MADPDSPPRRRAAGRGGAPDLKRPSQRQKASPPGTPFWHPHSEQRRPARARPAGPVLGPHARTNRTRDTQVAEPRLPAPEDARPGERQRLTPDAPHNGGRPSPPGTAPLHPSGTQPPQGRQAKGRDSAGPRHPHTRVHSMWVVDPDSPPGQWAAGGGGSPDLRRPSQRRKAPPPGTPFRHPHSAQRRPVGAHAEGPMLGPHARTNRSQDTRAAEPRPPAPEDGRPGEGQRLTPDAPHNGGRPPPPGDGTPPALRHAAPTGHASQGDSAGPPDPHTRAHSTWRADPDSPPGGRAAARGGAPDLRRPSQQRKAPPPGTPFCHPHSEQRQPARAHAVVPVLGPHARTDRTRDTRVVEPRLPAPKDGRPGEGQRMTPDAPHNSGRAPVPGEGPPPPPRQAAPTGHASQGDSAGPPHPHTRAHSTWGVDPDSPPGGPAAGRGGAPDLKRPSQRRKAPPPGMPFRQPHSVQRLLAGAHAVGPVPGPHARTDRIRTHGSRNPGWPPWRTGGPEKGQRLTPDAPHTRATPPGDGPPPPPRHEAPTGHASQGDSAGPPQPHTSAHSTWVADPDSLPGGRAAGGGGAPERRRPSQRRQAPPRGTPSCGPHSAQRRPARARAVGPVLGPHAHTNRTRDTWVAEPRPPAPEDRRSGEGQRLARDAPDNGGRPPPPGTAPQRPRGTQPPQGMQAKKTVLRSETHTAAPTARG